jgi:hypothetical protein
LIIDARRPCADQEANMFFAINKRTVLALAIAAAAVINLASAGPAAARGAGREAYTEGLWKEPPRPTMTVDPRPSGRGGPIRTEPVHSSAGRPLVLSPMPR